MRINLHPEKLVFTVSEPSKIEVNMKLGFFSIQVFLVLLMGACAVTTTKKSYLEYEDSKRVAAAIQTENLPALQHIFSKIPSDKALRSSTDQSLLDQALQMVAAKGADCNRE